MSWAGPPGDLGVEVRGGAERGEFPYLGRLRDEPGGGTCCVLSGKAPGPGDVLLEVNGTPVSGLTNRDTLAVIRHFREPIRLKTVKPGRLSAVSVEGRSGGWGASWERGAPSPPRDPWESQTSGGAGLPGAGEGVRGHPILPPGKLSSRPAGRAAPRAVTGLRPEARWPAWGAEFGAREDASPFLSSFVAQVPRIGAVPLAQSDAFSSGETGLDGGGTWRQGYHHPVSPGELSRLGVACTPAAPGGCPPDAARPGGSGVWAPMGSST